MAEYTQTDGSFSAKIQECRGRTETEEGAERGRH